MELTTTRFGVIQRSDEDVLRFPCGLFGFEQEQDWILLADASHGGLFWLQNIHRPDVSLAVVDPREVVDDYQLCISRFQLSSLEIGSNQPVVVLSVVSHHTDQVCLNLRNPIVINPENRLGRQVVARDDRPLQFELPDKSATLRKAA